MGYDLTSFLQKWDYQSGEIRVRRFKGRDGRRKIQLRLDLGVLQMEVEGRPDGKRPLGQESWLHVFRTRLEQHQGEHGGDDEGFRLGAEECSRLHQEAVQYYHRYICLFQLGDHAGVLRDTERNLEAFRFLERYADVPEVGAALAMFKPQLLLLRTRAQGALALEADDPQGAVRAIEAGMEAIRRVFREQNQAELAEQASELRLLEAWIEELQPKLPRTRRQRLEAELAAAIRREDYEKAAQLRDALKQMKE